MTEVLIWKEEKEKDTFIFYVMCGIVAVNHIHMFECYASKDRRY